MGSGIRGRGSGENNSKDRHEGLALTPDHQSRP